jgi:hypothetical protein
VGKYLIAVSMAASIACSFNACNEGSDAPTRSMSADTHLDACAMIGASDGGAAARAGCYLARDLTRPSSESSE